MSSTSLSSSSSSFSSGSGSDSPRPSFEFSYDEKTASLYKVFSDGCKKFCGKDFHLAPANLKFMTECILLIEKRRRRVLNKENEQIINDLIELFYIMKDTQRYFTHEDSREDCAIDGFQTPCDNCKERIGTSISMILDIYHKKSPETNTMLKKLFTIEKVAFKPNVDIGSTIVTGTKLTNETIPIYFYVQITKKVSINIWKYFLGKEEPALINKRTIDDGATSALKNSGLV